VPGTLMPVPRLQFSDVNGVPLPGALIYFFTSGTATPQPAFSDAGLTTPLTQPAVCDAGGFLTAYLSPGVSYKIRVESSTAVVQYTVDPVNAVPASSFDVDIPGTAGEALTTNDAVYLSLGDGGRVAGRWYKTDADFDYASTTATAMGLVIADIASGSSGNIRINGRFTGLAGLSIGSVYYASATAGALTATPPTNARRIGVADSTTSLILSHWLPIVNASSTLAGLVSLGDQQLGTGVKDFEKTPRMQPGTSSGTFAPMMAVVDGSITPGSNSGTGETVLMTLNLPGNALPVDGKGIRVVFKGTATNAASTKDLRCYFTTDGGGATGTNMCGSVVGFQSGNAQVWTLEIQIWRTAAATQKAHMEFRTDSAGTLLGRQLRTTPAQTMANPLDVVLTGQSNNASTEITVQEGWIETLK
jgi:hypothetical protein